MYLQMTSRDACICRRSYLMNPKTLLDDYEIAPKKSLGQNFLHDPNALEKIVTTAEIMPSDIVLEVGAGTGTLTQYLAQAARRVISVEVDERLKPILDEQLADYPNVWVIYQDILELDAASLLWPDDYIVVANLPYYITSAILRQLLEHDHRPMRLVLTVQLEVAERIIAQPGNMSVLSASVQFYGQPKIVSRLKPAAFWPRPDVTSAVVRIDTYDNPPVDVPDADTFFHVVRAGFGQKRKQLKNSLGNGLHLDNETVKMLMAEAEIDPRRRAETLSLEEWAILTRTFAALTR
ncbi:MAG: ribosomal RNA small subunit methyltransferase A [Phototrophicales bacterium]|nr:MAG: ribosomal RNA small subunit methyltransferase A [Phototrophicales bacterium]